MEYKGQKEELKERKKIHAVLAHSYIVYFFTFLVGLFLDFIFPISIFKKSNKAWIGIVLLIFGSVLIFWAQEISRNFSKENLSKKSFSKGPYKFTKDPTNWGIFLLIFGFGLIINAFFIILLTTISFIISKIFFLKKQEEILADKYGEAYLEYKKSMKF